MIGDKTAEELIESVFTFDYVGDSMMEVRRDLAAVDLQQKLIKETVEAAVSQADDNSPESIAVLTKQQRPACNAMWLVQRPQKGPGAGDK